MNVKGSPGAMRRVQNGNSQRRNALEAGPNV